MSDALLDALHKRWAEKHEKWLENQERKRARLNGSTEMVCPCGKSKKGKGGRGGGKKRAAP